MQKPWLAIFRVAVMAGLAARRQIRAPQSSKSEYHLRVGDLPFLVIVLTTLPASKLRMSQLWNACVEGASQALGATAGDKDTWYRMTSRWEVPRSGITDAAQQREELDAKISAGIDILKLWVRSAQRLGLTVEFTERRRME